MSTYAKLSKLRSNHGFTLVNTIIAAGIAGLLAMVVAYLQLQSSRSVVFLQLQATRDSISAWLDRSLIDPKSLNANTLYSGANSNGNLGFQYCYKGTSGLNPPPACAPNCCIATTMTQPQPFNLTDPSDPSGQKLLAGTQASTTYNGQTTTNSPARFTVQGAPCNTAAPNCPIEVFASYVADCAGTATCGKAASLRVTYTIRQAIDPTTNKPITIPGITTLRTLSKTIYLLSSGTQMKGMVYTGHDVTCAISNGAAWCWGYNDVGQLGDGTTTDRSTPVRVQGILSNVTSLAVGHQESCAIVQSGVWCWGANNYGQLGNGTSNPSSTPIQIPGFTGVQSLVTSESFFCALSNGNVWCWGLGTSGQIGNGGMANVNTPTSVLDPTGSSPFTNVQAISAGIQHACAVSNGNAYCWGDNTYGQLGNNTNTASSLPVQVQLSSGPLTNVSAIAAGPTHTCAISSGTMYCWGSNTNGELGTGPPSRNYAVPMSWFTGVQAISVAQNRSCALADGLHQCWGYNGLGQFGDNTTNDSKKPVVALNSIGSAPLSPVEFISDHDVNSCAVVNGSIWCWGHNDHGQLGNGLMGDSWIPVAVLSPQ